MSARGLTESVRLELHAAAADAVIVPGASGLDLTEDGLANALGESWKEKFRFVSAWGQWMLWNGYIWRPDDLLAHMTHTRAFLRSIAGSLSLEMEAKARTLRRADTVNKVVRLARSNEAQAAAADQWDSDPWLLGTPDGTVDLRTGELRKALPEDYITKATAVAPASPGTLAPLWEATLDRVTGGDPFLMRYHKLFAGYALTGIIREHVFRFDYGTGANGKTTIIGALQGVLGDYTMSIPTEMLMVSSGERHPTELAMLRGVRLAVGQETEQGKRWAEARIKQLTGGDPIRARFMRQDFFEFAPQFKLIVVGNHRPSLRGVDEAMRRRLHLVPFHVTIPKEQRDPDLPERLREEWPAILRWAIDGCLEWQASGLVPPKVVVTATEQYLDAEDAFSLWLDECVERDPNACESSANLFASWKAWAERSGEFIGSQKQLSTNLQERGFATRRESGTGRRAYAGLRLRPGHPSQSREHRS